MSFCRWGLRWVHTRFPGVKPCTVYPFLRNPRTGNRRPFQFPSLSGTGFNLPYAPGVSKITEIHIYRVYAIFTYIMRVYGNVCVYVRMYPRSGLWILCVKVCEKSVSGLKTVCALDKTAVSKISTCRCQDPCTRARGSLVIDPLTGRLARTQRGGACKVSRDYYTRTLCT